MIEKLKSCINCLTHNILLLQYVSNLNCVFVVVEALRVFVRSNLEGRKWLLGVPKYPNNYPLFSSLLIFGVIPCKTLFSVGQIHVVMERKIEKAVVSQQLVIG